VDPKERIFSTEGTDLRYPVGLTGESGSGETMVGDGDKRGLEPALKRPCLNSISGELGGDGERDSGTSGDKDERELKLGLAGMSGEAGEGERVKGVGLGGTFLDERL